jgi:Asp-tRNA(Asn)/Glu-tRNA(Gln) amidotransferase A subunit family amidase
MVMFGTAPVSNSRLIRPLTLILLLGWSSGCGGVQASRGATSAQPFRLVEATIDDAHAALTSGQLSCRALVEGYLRRIEAYGQSGPNLNAIETVNPRARQEADRLDAAFKASGPVGPLHCIPVLVKDSIETSDMPTTYGSVLFKDFVPQRDATIVIKLKQAGAIILAKTTLGEFNGNSSSRPGMGSYVDGLAGAVRNAYDPTRTAGGSSSGTGSGIAANFGLVGIGMDGGGSIRCPAAFGSLVGLRSTVPLVSRYGAMPGPPSQFALGPMTRTVKDAALVLDVIAGYDPNDPATAYAVGRVPSSYAAGLSKDGLKGARIGVVREPMLGADREQVLRFPTDPTSDDYKKVRAVMDKAIVDLRRLGAELVDPLKLPDQGDRTVYERGSFDGQTTDAYLAQHPNAPVKTLRKAGRGGLTDEIGYLRLLKAREELRVTWLKLMADYHLDAVVYATNDHQPTLIPLDVATNPDAKDTYTVGMNRRLAAHLSFPALTVPAGFTSDNLPVGIEFMGRPYAESTLFRLAYAYEQGTRNRRPPPTMPELPRKP